MSHTKEDWFLTEDHFVRTDEKIIAKISSSRNKVSASDKSPKEEEANGKLIAAAPDMLKALKACEEVLWMHEAEIKKTGFNPTDVINKAKAAISKATE